jgi:hypothetical protein
MQTIFNDQCGTAWWVDDVALSLVCRQSAYHHLLVTHTKTVRETHSFGPDLVDVRTDWDAISRVRQGSSKTKFNRIWEMLSDNPRQALESLVAMRKDTASDDYKYYKMLRATSDETMENVAQSVSRGENGLAAARWVRDTAAKTIVTCAVLVPGGNVAMLAGGAGLKALFKYQDTYNIASATWEGSATFIVGVIPIWGASSPVFAVVAGSSMDGGFELMKGLVDGKSIKESVVSAAATFGVDLITNTLGTVIDKKAWPLVVKYVRDMSLGTGGDWVNGQMKNALLPAAPPAIPQFYSPFLDAYFIDYQNATISAESWIRENVLRPIACSNAKPDYLVQPAMAQ